MISKSVCAATRACPYPLPTGKTLCTLHETLERNNATLYRTVRPVALIDPNDEVYLSTFWRAYLSGHKLSAQTATSPVTPKVTSASRWATIKSNPEEYQRERIRQREKARREREARKKAKENDLK